jgi:carbohydrate-binding DOMON domain-containing protein
MGTFYPAPGSKKKTVCGVFINYITVSTNTDTSHLVWLAWHSRCNGKVSDLLRKVFQSERGEEVDRWGALYDIKCKLKCALFT